MNSTGFNTSLEVWKLFCRRQVRHVLCPLFQYFLRGMETGINKKDIVIKQSFNTSLEVWKHGSAPATPTGLSLFQYFLRGMETGTGATKFLDWLGFQYFLRGMETLFTNIHSNTA
ncbi:hypothetical protein T2812B_06555 [Thermotoga sp. 2812B]|nr:hypothetical protein T2812B_06555 [Thermotoga sp. 2812B]EJX25562.1 hypothetical protein EMP_07202 [Thermotoga sp. EMP]